MVRIITALFDSRADAEAARDGLKSSKVDISGIHIVDNSTDNYHPDATQVTRSSARSIRSKSPLPA